MESKLRRESNGAGRLYPLIAFLICWTAAGFFFGEGLSPLWLFGLPVLALLAFEAPLWLWLLSALPLSILYGEFYYGAPGAPGFWAGQLKHLWLFAMLAAGWGAFVLLRFYCVSLPLCLILRKKKALPAAAAAAEKEALEAGDLWMEGEFFKSRPDFQRLFASDSRSAQTDSPKNSGLTEREESFLKKQTAELCGLSGEWEIIRSKKFPAALEEALKREKFCGMLIPKEYGGHGFSPLAGARAIQKIASVNLPAAVVAMVPNSLGPAELLLHYGTAAQKKKHLKKLAEGEEIPCFGLTEPQAGSDAAAISSEGVLFRGADGRLKLRLNWSKRWITLAPKASLLGLAFQLKDPEGLLPEGAKTGITCALVPASLPGVETGLYHSAAIPFYNGPMKGKNVTVDAERAIIGGLNQAGKGWKMLMECLTLGRAAFLPSLCLGSAGRISRMAGAHARIREQFGRPVGKFEGVEEPLSRIAGYLYLMQAAQDMTLRALNQGLRPPIAAAITKYHLTELARKISADGMDIMGGAGLSLGPKNIIASAYKAIPITITVEGANILTRTFIIYGQGLARAHPFLRGEAEALKSGDFKAFDRLLWRHLYQTLCGSLRLAALFLTRGRIFQAVSFEKERRFVQKLAWGAALFFALSNLSVFLGGKLRRKGSLAGRYADMLSHLYIAAAVIWSWRRKGRPAEEWPAVKWGLGHCFSQIQKAAEGIVLNFPFPAGLFFLRPAFALLCRINPIGGPPSDRLSKTLAQALMENESFRDSLHANLHLPEDPEHQTQKLETARRLVLAAEPAREKIRQALKRGKLPESQACAGRPAPPAAPRQQAPRESGRIDRGAGGQAGGRQQTAAAAGRQKIPDLAEAALRAGVISEDEHESLLAAEAARWEAIQVDVFTKEEYLKT